MKYTIYQVNSKTCDYAFEWWDRCKDKFDILDYTKVYEGNIVPGENEFVVLEQLFEIFNIRRPEDFKGHSLSTSDVVQLGDKYYFCDSVGWKDITEYVK